MWTEIDEGIRNRIIESIKNASKVKAVIYLLLIAVVSVLLFFAVSLNAGDDGMNPILVALCIVFVCIGLMAVFYIYLSTVKEQSALITDALYMVVGKIVSKGSNNRITVRVPGDKMFYEIKCEPELYAKAATDVNVLVVSSSRKNERNMYGVDPSSYDKDGVL